MKLRATNLGAGWQHEVCEDKPKIRVNSLCMSLVMRRKYLIAWAWIFSVILGVWLINSFQTVENCSRGNKNQPESKKVQLIRVNDDPTLLNIGHFSSEETSIDEKNVVKKDRNMPIIFVGGVPRSGTTLMRAMLDAHPGIRCGEETRIVPRMIDMRHAWSQAPKEAERLQNAGITDELIDSALSAFILEIIVNHGKQADHLCNKDPLVLRHSVYVKTKLFPNAKFILMIRDGRASVHSMMSRKVTIKNFNLNSWHDCLSKWNMMIEKMYEECMELGSEACMPVYYEQLVLHPEETMKKILQFLEIPWNDAVIHHEKFIGDEISLSKIEFSTDQVVKPVNLDALTSWVGKIPQDIMENMDIIAPMLGRLGYDPMANPPKYGEADLKIKENTENIRKNPEFWKNMEKKYSNLVTD